MSFKLPLYSALFFINGLLKVPGELWSITEGGQGLPWASLCPGTEGSENGVWSCKSSQPLSSLQQRVDCDHPTVISSVAYGAHQIEGQAMGVVVLGGRLQSCPLVYGWVWKPTCH